MTFDKTYLWPFELVEVVLLKIDFVEQVLDFDSADLGSDWPKVIQKSSLIQQIKNHT